MQRNADEMYEKGWDDKSGAGVLNALKALHNQTDQKLTVKITQLRVNYNQNKQVESVDVFGTVRGTLIILLLN